MVIKHFQITSPASLDLSISPMAPVCLLHGEHSDLVLDLIRELIGDGNAEQDPDRLDDGRFVIHSDLEIDGKDYSVCYIRNADYMGDHRIAANFLPDSLAFSRDDTLEFLEKCSLRNKDMGNVILGGRVGEVSDDDRPLFVYCSDAEELLGIFPLLSSLNRQVFAALPEQSDPTGLPIPGAQIVRVGAVGETEVD